MSGITLVEEEGKIIQEENRRSPSWSEEHCEDLWDRVESVRHKLTRILNPAKLTPYLRQCKVIDEHDEDEVLNSIQYPLRITKAGRLLDILRSQGPRGLQAFMESLEFYHPEQYTQLTGKQPTHRCSLILDEEGPEGLTQFLLLEVQKLRVQLQNSQMSERRLSQRCRVAEDDRSRAERKAQELRHDRLQLERLRQDWESASRELGKLKDRHLEQSAKYSRALEEQGKASIRERDLLKEVKELKSKLTETEHQTTNPEGIQIQASTEKSLTSTGGHGCPPALPKKPPCRIEVPTTEKTGSPMKDPVPATGVIALMDILRQDRREAAEQRQELCNFIAKLQGEMQSTEEHRDTLQSQCEQLQLKARTLHLDWETEQKRSMSYFNQIMELEKERDQAMRSRDSLQLEYTSCLLDKNRLRKRIAELQANVEQQQRELQRETEKSKEQTEQSTSCLRCSRLSVHSEDRCYGPCCSLGLDPSLPVNGGHLQLRKAFTRSRANSEDSFSNSEENPPSLAEDEKDINRLSTFPFPPCKNSINRRFNTDFDLDCWGSDDNDNIAGEHGESSLEDSWNSLHSHLFPPDLVNMPTVDAHRYSSSSPRIAPISPSSSPPVTPKHGGASLADDITIIGGNQTGIFVGSVQVGSAAERCGLKEGSELLELEHVLSGGGNVLLSQCTAEVAHFSLQWWTEASSLKHRSNPEAYAKLRSQLSLPTFKGADSFHVRVNLSMEPFGDPPSLAVSCNDIVHVTDTRCNGKYQWRCFLVDPRTVKPLQAGNMPNYNRAQQLLLVKLRKMAVAQKDFKKKFLKKSCGRVRLVKAVDAKCSGVGAAQQVLYTLNKRHEEHLIPYSLVQPVKVGSKRPVIFSPSLLSRGLIERMMQPVDSGLQYNTCAPETIPASERRDKTIFLLDSQAQAPALGIRLESIQEVITQDKHCLLELGLPCVEGLLRQGIYPIVIHILPKSKKNKKLRKFFPRCEDESVMEEMCQAEQLQLETLPLLYCTLEPSTWSCTEDLLTAIRNAISSQQMSVTWVELDRLQ
ncbi:caspase recruitment domain-containing protein 11 isoform X1 [Hippocampus zosterae]|uniref:caspase recruitment domain-containing protein 11 isoform X1 n=2 Tax=Hippocampus zosterae TaxID=109293 RepID=UPI00223E3788|nr:caspase recruitment domain-containing protein 11 isoform X1 [Hippocampus zosterae]